MGDQPSHKVPGGPGGMVIAVQYWAGDEAAAIRLARLLADIEPRPRDDATIALVRRFDTPLSDEARRTAQHVSRKFPVMVYRSKREGTGHPAGCNGLAGGAIDHLARMWMAGELMRSSVFLAEADGCPLRVDWLDLLIAEHERTLEAGLAVTGAYMGFIPHINGTMVLEVPWWIDHPSVHVTPPDQGWDIFHRQTYLRAANRTKLIFNIHGSKNWTDDHLTPLGKEHTWVTSVKDSSVIGWAEQALVGQGPRELRELRRENERLRRGER
jgi:hypothetical protein